MSNGLLEIALRPPSIARSVDRSIARSLGRSAARSLGRSVARSLDRSVARPFGRSVARSLGRSIARSLGCSVVRSVVRSVGRAVAWSLDRSVTRPLGRPIQRSLARWSGTQPHSNNKGPRFLFFLGDVKKISYCRKLFFLVVFAQSGVLFIIVFKHWTEPNDQTSFKAGQSVFPWQIPRTSNAYLPGRLRPWIPTLNFVELEPCRTWYIVHAYTVAINQRNVASRKQQMTYSLENVAPRGQQIANNLEKCRTARTANDQQFRKMLHCEDIPRLTT